VPLAVEHEIPYIAEAVDIVVHALKNGGRLIYVGAGTSGRLGILDAAECPPTFGTEPGLIRGVIRRRQAAVFRSQEGAEDDIEKGATTLMPRKSRRGMSCAVSQQAAGHRSSLPPWHAHGSWGQRRSFLPRTPVGIRY